jgi:hypothetical protein
VLLATLLFGICDTVGQVETVGVDEVVNRLPGNDAVLIGM